MALDKLKDLTLSRVAQELLRENRELFYTLPASIGRHPCKDHLLTGGLSHHTAEVCHLAFAVASSLPQYKENIEVLAFSALFHDLGKICEYQVKYKHTDRLATGDEPNTYELVPGFRERIGHVVKSFEMVASKLNGHPLAPQIYHCILSHHGRLEWGSPVVPESQNAVILHQCDMISARV